MHCEQTMDPDFIDSADFEQARERAIGYWKVGAYHSFWLDADAERMPIVYHRYIKMEKREGRKVNVPYLERWYGWIPITNGSGDHKVPNPDSATKGKVPLVEAMRSTWNQHWEFFDAMRGQ